MRTMAEKETKAPAQEGLTWIEDEVHTLAGNTPPPSKCIASGSKSCSTRTKASRELLQVNTANTIMPVTVKQVRDALAEMKDEKLIINNTIISTVRLVGRILDPAMNETRMTFKVDDGTGSIRGGLWILVEEALASEVKSIKNGDYATLNGKIVTKSADPLLECYSCRKTTNFNDITLHFLHVISTHLELRKAMPCGGAHKNKMAKEEETPELGDNKKPISTPIDNSTVITDSQTYNPGKTLGTSVSDAIIQIVRELTKSGGMEGVTIKEIGEKLLTKEADLKTILIDLATVGEIYTTVDEEHFKATRTARRDK